MSPASLTSFIDDLEKYRLLEPEQLAEVRRLQGSIADVRGLAKDLIGRGWLSPYQANLVLTGRGQELLLGSYVLIERIGEGGMGQVYKARNWKMGRVVALKVIRQERLSNPVAVRRFEREIRAAAQLHHVNVVQTIDADTVQDTHLMVMELVEGGRDLNQLVKEQGPLPVGQACDYIRQAALGLQHAFERGMVHRDIKPHNLLLTSELVLKVLDMGLARMLDEEDSEKSSQLTMENTVMGTPDFIAPEQAIDPHRADIRADLYSLGCVFFYVLAGRAPFGGDSLTEKLLKHQTDPPPKVEELRPDVPEVIGRVIRKLMAKRPENRYQTPAELAAVLQAFLDGEPVQVDLADAPSATIAMPEMRPADPFVDLGSDETTEQSMPEALSPSKKQVKPRRNLWLSGAAAACVIGIVVLVILQRKGVGPDPGPPPAGKVKAVVECTNRWQDTGIDLEAGTSVTVAIQGKVKKKDWPESSAAGLDNQPRQRTLLLHVAPLCLLGRIGEQDPFPLGNVASLKPKESGRLFVQVNHLDLKEVSGRLTLELSPARHNTALAKRPGPVRAQAAETALDTLTANLARNASNLADLAKQVHNLREKYQDTPAAARANMLWHAHLAGISSPLDSLDAANLPTQTRELWGELDQPKELVAVFGEQGAWPVKALAFFPDKRFLLWAVEEKAGSFDVLSGKELPAFQAEKKITALVLSPTKDLALAATQSNDLLLWNPAGKTVKKLLGHKAPATSVLFSIDGQKAYSSSQDGTIRLWDMAGLKEQRRWEGFKGAVLAAALSPDDRVLAAAGQDLTMRFWNPAHAGDEGMIARGYPVTVSALSFSPDGWTLAAAHTNGQIKFWDMMHKEPRERSVGVSIPGTMPAIAYSPDGRWLLAGTQTGTLILWEADTARKLWEWKLPGPISSLAFAADSRHVALGMGNGVVFLFRLGPAPPAAPELAESTWQSLRTRAADPAADPEKLWRDLARFRGRFAGLPQAEKAAEFFWKLPSPLDRLDPADIPDYERAAWQPKELVAILGSQRLRHATGVAKVALSPDGKQLCTASFTGDIVLWDAETGKELKRLGNHASPVIGLAFHKDGELLVSGSQDGAATLWNVVIGTAVRTLKNNMPMAVAFSPDGKLLATTQGDNVVFRDVKAWTIVQTLKGTRDQVLSLAFSANGEVLATGSQNGTIRLWDVKLAKPLAVISQKEGPVTALAFHPEKQLLASAANTVKLWDVTASTPVKIWPGNYAVAFDQTGNFLAFASGNAVKLWDLAQAKLTELKGHIRSVRSVAFVGDGKVLASASEDSTARLWNVGSGKELIPFASYNGFPLAFSPDGRSLVCCGHMFHGPQSWDLAARPIKARTFIPQQYGAHGLAFSPDGMTLASGNYTGDTRLLLWDVARPGQYLVGLGHKGGIMQTAFSPDGRTVASCGTDNTVFFWDPFTGKPLGAPLVGHSLGITCLAYGPDGRWLATGSNDAAVRLWNLRTGNPETTFTEHGKSAVRAVAFSHKGDLFASVGADQKVHIRELAKRKLRTTLAAPPGLIYWGLAFSPDDKMLVTSSDKGFIYLWDSASGKKLKEWKFPFTVQHVAFAPDARHLAVAGSNGTSYILRLSKKGPGKLAL